MSKIETQVKRSINKTFENVLEEAYVAEPKTFSLRTELLSEKTKRARQEDFHKISVFKAMTMKFFLEKLLQICSSEKHFFHKKPKVTKKK